MELEQQGAPIQHPESQADSDEDLLKASEGLGFFSSLWSHGSWTPTSNELLRASEARILSALKRPYQLRQIPIGSEREVNTLIMGRGPPLVMLHGFGGGIGAFIANLDSLSYHHTLYVCDILGFGRSSRPNFVGSTAEEAEAFFIDSIKRWVDALGLAKFNLLGHSMGAFLSAVFTLKHPEYVTKLILADPWGVPRQVDPPANVTYRYRIFMNLSKMFSSPFTLLRAAGPWGLSLMNKVRPDLGARIGDALPGSGEHFMSYVYHCNAQNPSGEMAFAKMSIPIGWAARPLVDRLGDLPDDLKVYCIYGRETWMDYSTMRRIQQYVHPNMEIILLPEAGHHCNVDNVVDFNRAVYQCVNLGTMKDLQLELKEYQDFPQQRFAR